MFNVAQSIQAKAAAHGLAPAIINGTRIISYEALLDLTARVSNHLIDGRVPARSRIFLNIKDPDLRLIAAIACLHAGMIPYVLTDLGDLRSGVDYDFVLGSPVPYVPGLPADLVIDESVLHGKLSDGKLRDLPARGDDEMLFLAGTSGTTSTRKVIVERAGAFQEKTILGQRPPLTDVDRVVVTVGDATKYGFSYSLRTLAYQATIIRPDPDPPKMLRFINLYNATLLLTTPAELTAMVEAMEVTGIRAPSITWVVIVGSLFPKTLVERASKVLSAVIEVGYGSSEVGPVSRGPIDPLTFKAGYVGELFPNVELVGAGTAQVPRPIVLVNKRNLFCEYYSDGKVMKYEKSTCELPDLGYVDGNRLYLIGRTDEVLNVDGTKFAFSIVETAMRSAAGVEDVGIVNIPSGWDRSGAVIGIVGKGVDLGVLADVACKAVDSPRARSMFHFISLSTIVRNQSGKVDRAALLEVFRKMAAAAG